MLGLRATNQVKHRLKQQQQQQQQQQARLAQASRQTVVGLTAVVDSVTGSSAVPVKVLADQNGK